MKISSRMLFMMIMIMSTLLVSSTESWITMWMGLEINMMMFIPLMFMTKNKYSTEAMMIYFLTQTMASVIFIVGVMLSFICLYNSIKYNSLMMISMFIKLGMPPFHFWFPKIMKMIQWNECMIMMTWQKLAPLTVLNTLMQKYMMIMIMVAIMVGSIGGINQTSLQKIMAYSSISHMSWICMFMMNSNQWLTYLMIYSIMVIMISIVFKQQSMFYINQINSLMKSNMEKMMLSLMIMSMGGLPPLLGFMPKWMTIQSMMNSTMIFHLTFMVIMNLITLFYYLRMVSSILLINSMSMKWNLKSSNNNMYLMITVTNVSIPIIFYLPI
nr:NADH dehydrogenase subunit 2 [Myrmedobia distinguenda]